MYEQGEIVVVPFPFSDLSDRKQRPVLVLSKHLYNLKSDDIITCAMTSNIKQVKHSIMINNRNLQAGSIPRDSMIKVDKLFSLEKSMIKKRIGKVNPETFEKIRDEFVSLV